MYLLMEQISSKRKVESIEWIHNGSKILLWRKNYDCYYNGEPVDNGNLINECQIQVGFQLHLIYYLLFRQFHLIMIVRFGICNGNVSNHF